MFYYDEHIEFNRYVNLEGVEWRLIAFLLNNTSKYAENIWKMLKYPTIDCLTKPNLTRAEKIDLIYRDTGNSSDKRIFLTPYIDDAWEAEAARIDFFVDGIYPTTHLSSQVNIGVEVLVHNKINNILGEANEEDLLSGSFKTNPSEVDEDGQILVPTKSRATTLLRSVLALFNGAFVDGVGQMQHNLKMNAEVKTTQKVWNNRAYLGFKIIFCTLMSGTSSNSGSGY